MTRGAAPRGAAGSRGAPASRLFFFVLAAAALAAVPVAAAPRGQGPSLRAAAELLLLRGDLRRLDSRPALPPANREGLRQRIAGELGLLPWLLRQDGDPAGATRLRPWQHRPLAGPAARRALAATVDTLLARHKLDRAAFLAPSPTVADLQQARAIYGVYCAACHQGMGNGQPGATLPARDLFLMARREPRGEFLARMVQGVKGTAAIRFANPLTARQIGAMAVMFRRAPPSR
jgi:mono/diheme cytochrome c family protein